MSKKYELRYRVVENNTENEFNNELKYTLISVDFDTKTGLIRQKGFKNWSNHKNDLFTDRKMAEKWLCELNYNYFLSETSQLKQQLAEKDEEILDWKDGTMICNYEKMLAEKNKEVEELKQTINTLQQNTISASVDDVNLIHELENQLAEKDKEIETLKSIGGNLIWKDIDRNKQLKDQRHQVCEEIRKTFDNEYYELYGYNHRILSIHADDFNKKLDQIEKGE